MRLTGAFLLLLLPLGFGNVHEDEERGELGEQQADIFDFTFAKASHVENDFAVQDDTNEDDELNDFMDEVFGFEEEDDEGSDEDDDEDEEDDEEFELDPNFLRAMHQPMQGKYDVRG